MKTLYILAAFLVCSFASAQKMTTESFQSNGETLNYSKIDYSKYGVAHVFVHIYEDSEENKAVPQNAVKCLRKVSNLYHTFYYFLPVKRDLTPEKKKEIIQEFLKIVAVNEGAGRINLYLNFDGSTLLTSYQNEHLIRTKITNIKSSKNCDWLSFKVK